ncbi:MAG: DUF3047 domain-containing protein [Alphaproteobacteria bacterium]|nr:DUF3047 domain-containing protein [Alphaproteobacteria bacterium]
MTRRLTAAGLAFVAGLSFGAGVVAGTLPSGSDLRSSGWQVLTFPGIPASRFVGRSAQGIELVAENSSALLYRAISSEDATRRYLSWRWRVDENAGLSDLSAKGADDRPLALHVWFGPEPDDTNLFDRLLLGVQSEIFGVPLAGRVLTYVWGGNGGAGRKLVNPHTGPEGMMVVLRGPEAPGGRWLAEQVDIAADFEMAFGIRVPAAQFIALSADTDDLGGRSRGSVVDIVFADR